MATSKRKVWETEWDATLDTNHPSRPTVAEVIEFLGRFPPHCRVYGYEGEMGETIVVEKDGPLSPPARSSPG